MASPFEISVNLFVKNMTGPAVVEFHARTAKRLLGEFMAKQSAKPMVTLEVDHRPARSETEVKPFGLIVYRFSRMQEVVSYAMKELVRLSPVGGKGDEHPGLYRRSWVMLVNGEKTTSLKNIQIGATVTIVNPLPYARKIHTGAKGFEVHAGIVEKVRQLIFLKYRRMFDVEIEFISLSGGYILQGFGTQRLAKTNRMSSAFRKNQRLLSLRRDTSRGAEMKYPALVIRDL